ncbi:hypothetical protein VA596_49910 [Amycolatopsis sp., V23-08]|uniref:Scaffolding protein n=1 Tax=Amycolatopsis heterodermiae TaxID=3110235 RepID=A0ABU5RN35_9PSEU|nr:hypothetical protein [Amycolatopsis sp., V23-08]MEA5367727.1 hypothetical protein [Amycolatopsis sp., V23-08]
MTQPSPTNGPAEGGQAGTATTDPAGAQPGDGQQQPVTPAAGTTAAVTQPQGGQQGTPPKPGPATGKTFTQADLDAIVQKRMSGFEKSFADKLAGLFGGQSGEGAAAVKPEDVLKRAEGVLAAANQRANTATAEALAAAAGIKPERIDVFIGLANLTGVLNGVDQNDATAVKAAIKTAVDTEAAKYPEWKTDAPAAASGGDRTQAAGGKKTWTRAEISKMSQDELVANSDELQKAAAEGRIS